MSKEQEAPQYLRKPATPKTNMVEVVVTVATMVAAAGGAASALKSAGIEARNAKLIELGIGYEKRPGEFYVPDAADTLAAEETGRTGGK